MTACAVTVGHVTASAVTGGTYMTASSATGGHVAVNCSMGVLVLWDGSLRNCQLTWRGPGCQVGVA